MLVRDTWSTSQAMSAPAFRQEPPRPRIAMVRLIMSIRGAIPISFQRTITRHNLGRPMPNPNTSPLEPPVKSASLIPGGHFVTATQIPI